MSSQGFPEDENAPSKMDYYIATLAAGGLGVVLAGPSVEHIVPASLQLMSGVCFLVGLHWSCITYPKVLGICRKLASSRDTANTMADMAAMDHGDAEAMVERAAAIQAEADARLNHAETPSDEDRATASEAASLLSEVALGRERVAAIHGAAEVLAGAAKPIERLASKVRHNSASDRVWALSIGATLLLFSRFLDHRVFW